MADEALDRLLYQGTWAQAAIVLLNKIETGVSDHLSTEGQEGRDRAKITSLLRELKGELRFLGCQ